MNFSLLFESLWCTAGWLFFSYNGAAEEHGWTIGNIYRSKKALIFGFSGIMLPFIGAFFVSPWWASFIIVAGGFLLMSFILKLCKSKSQIVAPLLLITAIIVFAIRFL